MPLSGHSSTVGGRHSAAADRCFPIFCIFQKHFRSAIVSFNGLSSSCRSDISSKQRSMLVWASPIRPFTFFKAGCISIFTAITFDNWCIKIGFLCQNNAIPAVVSLIHQPSNGGLYDGNSHPATTTTEDACVVLFFTAGKTKPSSSDEFIVVAVCISNTCFFSGETLAFWTAFKKNWNQNHVKSTIICHRISRSLFMLHWKDNFSIKGRTRILHIPPNSGGKIRM